MRYFVTSESSPAQEQVNPDIAPSHADIGCLSLFTDIGRVKSIPPVAVPTVVTVIDTFRKTLFLDIM